VSAAVRTTLAPAAAMALVLLRHLWPLPWTALGLAAALAVAAGGGRVRWRDGALEATGGALGRLAARGPFAALTLGHVILACSARAARRLGAHERAHVRQYEAWGPLFVPAYLLAGLWQWLRGRHAHADNPFETAAGPT
jgi:hypothetical protein